MVPAMLMAISPALLFVPTVMVPPMPMVAMPVIAMLAAFTMAFSAVVTATVPFFCVAQASFQRADYFFQQGGKAFLLLRLKCRKQGIC